MSEDGGLRTEVGYQRAEDRRPMSEFKDSGIEELRVKEFAKS